MAAQRGAERSRTSLLDARPAVMLWLSGDEAAFTGNSGTA